MKWQRVKYQPNTPLGANGQKVTASKAHTELSKQAAKEGMVLLKNENSLLPFEKGTRLAVFGKASADYVKGGGGSGDVTVSYTVSLDAGLKALSDYVSVYEGLSSFYNKNVRDQYERGVAPGMTVEPEVPAELLKKARAYTDTALITICRFSGEGWDRTSSYDNGVESGEPMWKESQKVFERGDFYLSDAEQRMVETVKAAFPKVVVVLNVGGVVDSMWFAEDPKIQSVLMAWQGGIEGGAAAAELLCGIGSPSGKLADTFAKTLEDYPSSYNFHESQDYVDYTDDIYVGYRYFETFAPEKVQFEFGFGLSYTTFDIETVSADADDEKITLEVKVTNTGDKFSGKEVVQVYYEAPQGALGQPARQLCAYEKTENLAQGQSQTLKIAFDINGIASYDDSGVTGNKSCYVLEAGDYNFYVGNSVKNNKLAYTYKVEELKVTEQLSEAACPNDENLTLMKPGKRKEDGTYEITYVPSQKPTVDMAKRIEDNLPKDMKITGDVGITLQDVKAGKNTIEEFVAQLTVAELAQIVRGEGMSNPRVTKGTASAFGGLSDTLFAYGIPAACCADGPSGLRMEGKATQLPIGTALSASWNPKLVRELYTMEGQELYGNQVDTLLGPGVNIHRHPLNGRNFEYYSEDPYLSGTMSVASTGGIKDGGAWGTIKHFALNGQESHRFKIDAVCSERAIRQIYLKSFEMAVKAGTVKTLMTAYNPINGHWAASNYDLCTTILRNEWGYDGIVMTDWWAKMNDVVEGGEESNQDTRDMVRSQNDVYMVVNNNGSEVNSNNDNTEESIKEGRLTIGELQRAAINICNFILSAPVIERELVDTDVAKHYDSVPNDQAKYEVFNIEKDNKVMFNSGAEATLEVEDEGEYTIIVNISFDKSNLSQSTVNVNANGTTMVVIQTNGTDGNWITQKLCKVKLDKGVYNLKLEEVLAGIKVKYIQFKKIPKKNK